MWRAVRPIPPARADRKQPCRAHLRRLIERDRGKSPRSIEGVEPVKRLLAIGVCLLLACRRWRKARAAAPPSSWLPSAPQMSPGRGARRGARQRQHFLRLGHAGLRQRTVRGSSSPIGTSINEATGPISVHFPDGFYSLGTVQRVDRDWDLAVIVIASPTCSRCRWPDAAPRPGDTLTIAGYGTGTYRAASGRCTQYVAPGTTFPYEMVEVAVSARQGDSGGPIFNSQGELAGVLFGEGHGRTSGSYCGRVRWFLSNLVPGMSNSGTLIAVLLKPVPPRPPTAEVRADCAEHPLPPTPFIQASRASGIACAQRQWLADRGCRQHALAAALRALNALCGMGRRGRPFHRRAAKNLVGRDRRHADHHPHVALVRQGRGSARQSKS